MNNVYCIIEESGEDEGENDEGEGDKRAFQFAVIASIVPMFTCCNGFAEPHNGVRQPCGIAEQEVEQPTAEKRDEDPPLQLSPKGAKDEG